MPNPLDVIMEWHRTSLDSMRVTGRVIENEIQGAILPKHIFHDLGRSDSIARLDAAKNELDQLVVLSLTAVFERTLRDYLLDIPRNALPSSTDHLQAVKSRVLDDIDYWNLSSRVLDVFPMVDPKVRGHVRQVIEYRNWVAHGHTLAGPAPSNVTPARAHESLSDFLRQAGVLRP